MNDSRVFRPIVPVLAVLLPVLAALLVGCNSAPSPAASNVSQTRTVSGFDRVRLQGAFATGIAAGQHATRVVVTGDPDVIGRITTEVVGGTLDVGMRSELGSLGQAPKVQIDLPVLRSLKSDGVGSTTITGLTGGDVEIENAGVGSIVASGRASREKITLGGVGKIDATAVDARDVTVNNSGLGSVRVRASGVLTMNVSGVGKIGYAGNPSHVESHLEGVGRIERL